MARAIECTPDAMQLRSHELPVQIDPALRQIEQAPAAIKRTFLLHDIAPLDQFAQHAAERLLGDLQNVEKLGNPHAGIAADEMQDSVMGAPEADGAEDDVGIGSEIAIGEEQKLDQLDKLLIGHRFAADIYVNHVDIFCIVNYRIASAHCEGGVPWPPSFPSTSVRASSG